MVVRALVTTLDGSTKQSTVTELPESELGDGNVTVRINWSTVNWKDGSALHRSKVMKRHPLVGGIDFAGVVESTDHPEFQLGDRVVANGWELSQTHNGGFAERARVPGEWLVQLPTAIDTRQAMAIGTAGYTAMLCVLALERNGVVPAAGPLLVTGAAGGVGSIAVALLAGLGYEVMAVTGRRSESTYLTDLGAARIIDREEFTEQPRPLNPQRWAGAVDVAGSRMLANVLSGISYGGAVAACGLAQGPDLPGWVAPFILRGVSLAGIDSVQAPQARRVEAWNRLARDLDPDKLESTITEIGLGDVPDAAADILTGRIRGRTLVNVIS